VQPPGAADARPSQSERIIKLAIGEQPGIGRDHGAAKLQHQAAVEIEPNNVGFRFTSQLRHRRLARSSIQDKPLIAISESRRVLRKSVLHPVNAGLIELTYLIKSQPLNI
jgi:hypothetical protein